jgi:hypothetical protein
MNRKSTILAFIILTISISTLTAHDTIRTAGIMTWEKNSSSNTRPSDLNDEDKRYWGLDTETIHSQTGTGMDALVNFYTDDQEFSILDWQGQLFMRYHLIGARSFLDPYIEAGIGNAGTVRLGDGEELQMSLYPFISAGGHIVFHEGFYAGMRWSCRLDEWIIPGTVIPQPELAQYQVSFNVGFSYNWHNPFLTYSHDRHNHYHFD